MNNNLFNILESSLFGSLGPYIVPKPAELNYEQLLYDLADSFSKKYVSQTEDGKQLLHFDMPGIKESDIEMEYDAESGNLFVKAERKLDHKHYTYSNKIFIGKGLESSAIEAKFEDNVLNITISNIKQLAKPVHKILLK